MILTIKTFYVVCVIYLKMKNMCCMNVICMHTLGLYIYLSNLVDNITV